MLESWHIRPVSFKHYQRFAADLLGRAPSRRFTQCYARHCLGQDRVLLAGGVSEMRLAGPLIPRLCFVMASPW
jgi:hypothetical protein